MSSKDSLHKFNEYKELEGLHAFLSPSSYHWINYPPEKLLATYQTKKAADHGTRLHAFAKEAIELKQKLPANTKTLNSFINDAIGYRMKPEVILFYSPFAFGTADAISFREGFLRIHDLKTGVTKASMTQLLVYAALFSLEYKVDIKKIKIELRIYQNDEIVAAKPIPDEIDFIKEKIIYFDKLLTEARKEEL